MKPAIGISLLMHDLFKEQPDKANWHFILRDQKRPHIDTADIEIPGLPWVDEF